MKPDKLPKHSVKEGKTTGKLNSSSSHTQQLLEVRCYKVSILNKSSGEHDFHTVSAIGLLKSYVPLPVY